MIENQYISVYLTTIKDEMVLKSVLDCVRSIIKFTNTIDIKSQFNI